MLAGNEAYFPEFESDDFLEEVVLTSAAASVTFSGLDAYSDYKHLQMRILLSSSSTAADTVLEMRLNSDNGNNYSWHSIRGNGTSVTSEAALSYPSDYMMVLRGSRTADVYSAAIVDILDFASSSKNKTARSLTAGRGAGLTYIQLQSGLWIDTSPITSINFDPANPSYIFGSGSRFSLYGIKG
jgi:hypothetical protein